MSYEATYNRSHWKFQNIWSAVFGDLGDATRVEVQSKSMAMARNLHLKVII